MSDVSITYAGISMLKMTFGDLLTRWKTIKRYLFLQLIGENNY